MLGLVFWDQQFQYSDYDGNSETDESFEEALRYLDNLNILFHYVVTHSKLLFHQPSTNQ